MGARLTKHCRDRMAQRGVDEESIRATLDGPDRKVPDPGEGSMLFLKAFGDRTLKVWVVWPPRNPKAMIVKSTAWKGERDADQHQG
ncbi:DUF4258 domain-containing protein [Promicromonospora sp. CA-289599]|uniref:DUF4258 domain-containing protein n=1 Tax=Promicromonospora sp. CA-289599 TaxID=3240014 RepID=UPI003D8B661D